MPRRCLVPGCDHGRAQGHVYCLDCWQSVPAHLRERFRTTRPHSDERRAALLEIMRTMGARP